MSDSAENVMADFFGLLRELDMTTQPLKEEVLKNSLGDIDAILKLLSDNREVITGEDIYKFLSGYQYININKEQAYFFILINSHNFENTMKIRDFKMWLCPGGNMASNNPEENSGKLSVDAKSAFLKLLEIEMQFAEVFLKILDILKSKGINCHSMFHKIAKGGQISQKDLLNFLNNHSMNLKENEIEPILEHFVSNLADDKEQFEGEDRSIDYGEFHKIFCYPSVKVENLCPMEICPFCKGRACKDCFTSLLCPVHDGQTHKENEFPDIEKNLVKYFEDLMKFEYELNEIKKELSLYQDFNAEDCFRIFETTGNDYVDRYDISKGLNDLGIHPSESDLNIFMKKNSGKDDDLIYYEDFCDLITPIEQGYRDDVFSRKPNDMNSCVSNLSKVTKNKFIDFLKTVLDVEKELNERKNDLNYDDDLLREIFPRFKDGKSLTHDEFMDYIKNNIDIKEDKEIELLFTRIDKNKDGKIQIEEIKDEIRKVK